LACWHDGAQAPGRRGEQGRAAALDEGDQQDDPDGMSYVGDG